MAMSSNEFKGSARHDSHRSRFELFYFEQVGSRHHLRFTRLALILIVCLTVIPVMLLFALFLSRQQSSPDNVNINIVVPTPAPHDYSKPIIQPPSVPPPTPPKVSNRPGASTATRQTPLAPNSNAGGSFTPSPTPSPSLARPPT